VRRGRRPFAALDLSDWIAGHPGRSIDDTSTGEIIDRQALAAYRARIIELDAELAQARDWADEVRITRLSGERDALLDEVGAATGLGGRSRHRGAAAERARVAVGKAIAAAIDRVTEIDATVGRVLSDCVRTGTTCRYDPDPTRQLTWMTDD